MTETTPEPNERKTVRANPYVLLALAALLWSGNHIVGRAIGGHVPPVGVSAIRWVIAAPSAWMASVSRRNPGTASGRIQMPLPSVRPPGETAQ